jgi:hypothetical protein
MSIKNTLGKMLLSVVTGSSFLQEKNTMKIKRGKSNFFIFLNTDFFANGRLFKTNGIKFITFSLISSKLLQILFFRLPFNFRFLLINNIAAAGLQFNIKYGGPPDFKDFLSFNQSCI